MRDVKHERFLGDTSSSPKRGKFHSYRCKIDIYAEKEYRDNLKSKAQHFSVVFVK